MSNSIVSSRPIKTCKNFSSKTNFVHELPAMRRPNCIITPSHRTLVTVLCATRRFGIASSYFFEDGDDDDDDDDNTMTLTPAS